ncbi:MAG: serine hydrolase domain-containing protein, partial [Desulfonatronovibrionaceae bacterium]
GDRVVWSAGFGSADLENRVPAAADTVYMLGSISKTLTAVSVLQLYEQGKIADLNDPLDKYLDSFSMQKRYPEQMQEMTVKRTLNHHSGIPGDIMNCGFVSRNWDDWQTGLYTRWLLGYLKQDYPSHRPGEVASYSNTGFTLAGEAVRKASGEKRYRDYVRKNIFKPLGMENSSFRQIKANAAKGYFQGEPICPDSEVNMTPTGGAYTTAEDMAEFIKMILNRGRHPDGGRILEPESVDLMGGMEKTPLDVDSYFQPGLGLDSADDPVMRYAGRAWTKDGGTKNFQTFMEILPDKGLGVVVLANSDTAAEFKYFAARECLRNALEEKYGLQPSGPDLPEYESVQDSGDISGMYVHAGGFDLVRKNEDGRLIWTRDACCGEEKECGLQYDPGTRRYSVQDEEFDLVFINREWQGKDYTLMLRYGDCGRGAYISGKRCVRYLGQKTGKPDIPRAWERRLNKKYIIEDIAWNDIYLWEYTFFELKERAGVLMLSGMVDQPVFPKDNSTAFLRGLLGQREDSSVRVAVENGREKLVTAGFQAYDAELVPRIEVGQTVSGKTDFLRNKWYRLELDSDPGSLSLDAGSRDYVLRVMDGDLVHEVIRGQGSLTWEAGPGTWYIAVCPTPDAPAEFWLRLSAL